MKTWRDLLLPPHATIKDAILKIESTASQIVLIVTAENLLLGTVTDGDVRRAILKGKTLLDPVRTIMNQNPVVVSILEGEKKMMQMMRQYRIRHLPCIDDKGIVQELKVLDDLIYPKRLSNRVILMVGGLGTRLEPLTHYCPKPLLKVGNKPILETTLEQLIEAGFHSFYFLVNYKAEMISEYFGDGSAWGVNIQYIVEKKRMGTAGGLKLIEGKTEEPMIIMNGDLLTKLNFAQLLHFHSEMKALGTICVRQHDFQVPYGVVQIEEDHLVNIIEKPIQSHMVNAGIYVLDPEVIEHIPNDSFLDMPDLFRILIHHQKEIAVFPIREYWIDIGQPDDFKRANQEYDEWFS